MGQGDGLTAAISFTNKARCWLKYVGWLEGFRRSVGWVGRADDDIFGFARRMAVGME